jgi:hypothetical protein
MALVRAARRLADARTTEGREVRAAMVRQGPLSAQGVDLALCDHLELEPSTSERDALIEAAGDADYVHVLLSANVFVGALRALAIAVAAAPRVTVRMSRRESVFARELLSAVEDPDFGEPVRYAETPWIDPALDGVSCEVHLYGHDETIVQVAANLPETVRVRAHGAGMGIAVIGGTAELGDAAEAIAASVIPFDQRGCLSPRVVLVDGGQERATAVAHQLASSLARGAQRVPIGTLSPEERAEATRYGDTCRMVGDLFEAGGGSVGLTSETLWVPPVGRNVHVVSCDPSRASALLSPLRRMAAAVGIAGSEHDALPAAVLEVLPRARVSAADRMQKPLLDGPVDRRTPDPQTPADVVRCFGAAAV